MNMLKYALLSFFTLMLFACGGSIVKEGLIGKVTLEGYEGKQVYLMSSATSPVIVDSAMVKDGEFFFQFSDSIPQIYNLVLRNSIDDNYPIMLPVISEKGLVRVSLGQLVYTSGTPLNDSLQDFLLAISNFTDKSMQDEHMDLQQIKVDFANLIEGAVLNNINTPVGIYIYRMYYYKLSDSQKEKIMSRANESFKEAVK